MRITKRIIDITCGTITLLVLSPLLTLISLAVYLEDRRSPLFLQRRYGKGEKIFLIMKFRTMRIVMPDEKRKIEDLKRDGRITKVGRFLRSAHLDELPQLINIIKGDMSIVGPRPVPCIMQVEGIENWEARNVIKPGLTGMAQLYCTKYTALRKKFRFDVLYIKRESLLLDARLVMATAWSIKKLLAFALWTGVILAATLLPITEESISATGFVYADKLAHYSSFMVMAFIAIWFGGTFLGSFKSSVVFGILWGLLLAGSTELAQFFLPLRNMSLPDIVADIAGIGVGCAFTLLIFIEARDVKRQNIKTS